MSDARIVRDGELPDDWGLMAMRGGRLMVVRKAPRRDALPLTPTRLAALLRSVACSATVLERRRIEREQARREAFRERDHARQELGRFVMCGCTQVPELGPCEHQKAVAEEAS